MTWDLHDYRIVTASAYPGMMAPLTEHPSCAAILSGDNGPSSTLSLEKLDGIRRRWRLGDVARLAEFVPKVVSPRDDRRPIALVPPRVSPAWEAAAQAWPADIRLVGRPSSEVGPLAEDKIYVRSQLAQLGVPVPRALVVDEPVFELLASTLDGPFVLQTPDGAGGQGTSLVRNPADLAAALRERPHVQRWLSSQYCGDVTINVAGVIYREGVQLFPASVQYSGIPELAAGFGSYCGSAFGQAAIAPALVTQAEAHTRTIAEWLRRRGHLGLFGVDIAVGRDGLAFLEINPRVQGSSWLLGRLQRRAGQVSCLELHVQALLGRPSFVPADESIGAGSHLLWRWSGPAGIVCATPDLP